MGGEFCDLAIMRLILSPQVLFRANGIEAQDMQGKKLKLASTAHGEDRCSVVVLQDNEIRFHGSPHGPRYNEEAQQEIRHLP